MFGRLPVPVLVMYKNSRVNNLTQNQQNNKLSANDQKKSVAVNTPTGGDGNTPLKHGNVPRLEHADIWKRILSKEFCDLSWEAKNTCPIGGVSVNLDYFQCTGLITPEMGGNKKLLKLQEFVQGYLDVPLILSKKAHFDPQRTYAYTYRTNNGIIFAYSHLPEGIRYALQFPGIPLRMLKVFEWKNLISGLFFDYHCTFTRADICVDDYKRRITGRRLIDITQKGDIARVLKYWFIESGTAGSPGEVTCYWGGGRKQLYFYNALHLHGLHADRYECRLRETKAIEFLSIIAQFEYTIDDTERDQLTYDQILQRMLQYMGSICLGAVDFLYRNGRKGRSTKEFKRYDFWEDLGNDVGGILHLPVPVPKLDTIKFVAKTVKWLSNSVFKRLAIVFNAIGQEAFFAYINQEINLGALKFDDYDLAWIAKIKSLFDSLEPDSNVTHLDVFNFLKNA